MLRVALPSFAGSIALASLIACGGGSSTTSSESASNGGGADGSTSTASATQVGGTGAGNVGGSSSTGALPSGTATSGPGTGGAGAGNGFCGTTLRGTIRDFKTDHPDFEYVLGSDPGIVEQDLGPDGKPVYAGPEGNPTTTSKEAFDQWYRDVPGVNQPLPIELELTPSGGDVYTFSSSAFFPIDGQGFGNEGNPHNYHFTLELRTHFVYAGGEVFRFTGDDDLFTFINGKLVIDLGGVHGAESAEVALDSVAGALGLEKGKVYPLDFFFAERHTVDSNFRIDTTISFTDCGGLPVPN